MREWKRILAGIGSAALLLSSVGVVPRATFAAEAGAESTATEIEEIELQTASGGVTESDAAVNSADDTTDVQPAGDETAAGSESSESTGSAVADAASGGQSVSGSATTGTESSESAGDTTTATTGDGSSADSAASGSASDGTGTNGGTSTGSESGGSTDGASTDATNDGSFADDSASDAASDGASVSDGSSASDTTADSADGNAQTANDASNAGADTTATDESGTGDDAEDGTDDANQFENDDVDGLTVKAVASADDAIPEGYELKVTEITDASELERIAEQLTSSDSVGEFDGFVAYDVGFVNADGEETEPRDGTSVKVTFAFEEGALPSGIDQDSLEIQHIEQSNDTSKVVTVADAGSKTDGTIDVKSANANDSEDADAGTMPPVTATFEVGSLSPLVWTYLLGDGTSTASISGSTTVEIGDTIQLSCSDCRSGWWSRGTKTWTSSNESIATFNGGTDTSRPSLRGVARGTVTITHTHADRNGNTQISTYDVTVKAQNESDAIIYALKTPDSDPDSNDGSQWTDALGIGIVNATISDFHSNKNITNNPQQYMVSWPDGQEGATWTLTSSMTGTSADCFTKVLDEVFTAYSDELKEVLGITDITKDNIKSITLTPHKISRNNGGTPDMHVDCKISITCEKAYDVKFWVKDVGATGYQNTYSVTDTYVMRIEDATPTIQKVVEPDANKTLGYQVGDTKVVDGITYRMTGWHTEDTTTHNTPSDKTVDLTGEGYEPVYEEELYDDNVANYYAEWKALTGDLQVTKAVTGDTGYVDPNSKYQIVIHLDGDKNKNRDYGTYHFDANGDCTVTLANGESVNIIGITSGTKYTVTEAEDSGKGFTVTYDTTYYKLDESGNKVTVTDATDGTIYPEGTADVTVSNERRVVRTGVVTDTAPWVSLIAILTLALAGTGWYQGARRHYTR